MQDPLLQAPAMSALPGHWLRLDAVGRVVGADPALGQRLAGGGPPLGQPFSAWLTASSRALWSTNLWPRLLTQGRLDEALLDLEAGAVAASLPDGGPAGWPTLSSWRAEAPGTGATFIGLLTPGLERRRLLAELRQAHDSLESMPGAVLQVETLQAGRLGFPYASHQLLDLLGVTPAQAASAPQRLLDALAPASRAALETAVAHAEATGSVHWLVVLIPRREPLRRLELSARRALHGPLWHGVLTDISEHERLQHELRHRAETDPLTRLPNRVALMTQVRQRLEAGRRFALLFMDCDRFKQVNDSLGHEAGDELLRHLAQRLRHGLRPADALLSLSQTADEPLAARLGGDEFVVLADGVADADAVAAVADRLVKTMAHPYRLQGMELVASVSVGVVLADRDSTAERLLRDADTAMYEAKRRGRGGWVLFESEMHERVAANLALEADLRQALQAGQLRAVFQPIIEITTGRVVGMEALARWHHPQRGEVPPSRFIPLAEESGLMAELGETILRLACVQFAAWRRGGLPVPPRLSVNLSRAQLTDGTLPGRVGRLLDEAGLPCSALQLEVTESLAMDDASVRQVLMALRALGVQLALDDFGTGHSSLASLQHFPVQQVKIDRAFVQEIDTSDYHRALVQAALQVAQALNLEVVAEGVETAAQARLLAELGCTRAQGWLYARALEAAAVPAFLASEVPRVLDDRRPGHAAPASLNGAHRILVTDPEGRTVHVNAAFTRNTGYTLDDLRGRSPGSVLQGPDTDPRAVRALGDALRTGAGCTGVEILNYRKDGTPFNVLMDIEPVRDAGGRIVQFISLQTEITERRRDEQELAELRLRIDDVRALGLVGFWERDLTTGSSSSDVNAQRMLGLRPGMPNLSWEQLLQRTTPESKRSLERFFADVRRGAMQGLVEYTIRHDDGQLRDLQVHWSRRGERLLGLMVDVSVSRHRQADQLRLLRQIELAAAAADQFFWVHDLHSGRVTWMPEGRQPFAPGHEVLDDAMTYLGTVLPEDRAIVHTARQRAQQQAGMVEATYRVHAPDGSVRTLLTRRIGLPEADGTVRSVVGISIDVTGQPPNAA